MPGRFFLLEPLAGIAAAFGARLEAADPGPRTDAAPGEEVALLVADPGRRLIAARWSMIMTGRVNARKRPVMETIVNARSETVFGKSAYQGVRRAVLPISGWYEWTGTPGRKIRWAIRDPGRAILPLAAIWDVWRGPGGVEVAQMATLTVEPSADVRDIHHRMPVILSDEAVAHWLEAPQEEAARLLVPAPDGTLSVTRSDLP